MQKLNNLASLFDPSCFLLSSLPTVNFAFPISTAFSKLLQLLRINTMAFKAFVVLVALCLVSLASGFVAPTAFARNGEWVYYCFHVIRAPGNFELVHTFTKAGAAAVRCGSSSWPVDVVSPTHTPVYVTPLVASLRV